MGCKLLMYENFYSANYYERILWPMLTSDTQLVILCIVWLNLVRMHAWQLLFQSHLQLVVRIRQPSWFQYSNVNLKN